MPVWLTEDEYRILVAVCDRLMPPGDDGDSTPGTVSAGAPGAVSAGAPGAVSAGAPDYIDGLLGAFEVDPPRIWAGGPFSGRHGGVAGFGRFHPLGRFDELAWRTRIEGSQGRPEREFNGPVVGFQERYREGLAALGADFPDVAVEERDRRLHAGGEFTELVFRHCCEGMYGAPEYLGNRDLVGWESIGFAGDVQPAGYRDDEVSAP